MSNTPLGLHQSHPLFFTTQFYGRRDQEKLSRDKFDGKGVRLRESELVVVDLIVGYPSTQPHRPFLEPCRDVIGDGRDDREERRESKRRR